MTTSSEPVEAVIFDFGGVLSGSISDLIGDGIRSWPADGNGDRAHALEEVLPLMMGPLRDDTDHPWHRAERGEITFAEAVEGIGALARELGYEDVPTPPTPETMLRRITGSPTMIAAARKVRDHGIPTAILTNNFTDFVGWQRICDADELVDVVIESCKVGMRKPTREIYELTLSELGHVPAPRALFLDDFAWNIEGARAVGLQTIHVTDHEVAAAELVERLRL